MSSSTTAKSPFDPPERTWSLTLERERCIDDVLHRRPGANPVIDDGCLGSMVSELFDAATRHRILLFGALAKRGLIVTACFPSMVAGALTEAVVL